MVPKDITNTSFVSPASTSTTVISNYTGSTSSETKNKRDYNETGAKDDPFIRNEQIDVSKIHHGTAAKSTRLAGLPPPTGTSHMANYVPMLKTASDDQQHNDYCLQRTITVERNGHLINLKNGPVFVLAVQQYRKESDNF